MEQPSKGARMVATLRQVLRFSRLKKILFWMSGGAVLLLVAVLLYAHFWFLPNLRDHLPEIEAAASEALGQPVAIGGLEARLGLRPFIHLEDVRVFSSGAATDKTIAIRAANIEGSLSWRSLFGQPIFASLTVNQPELTLARGADGRWQVVGMNPAVESGEEDPLQWLLAQQQIRVAGARFHVQDNFADAPDFSLTDVELDWRNRRTRHRFGLTARAIDRDGKTVATVDVRGDLRGEAETPLADWQGRLYFQWQADALTPWRGWLLANESKVLPLGTSFDLGRSEAQVWLERGSQGWQATADMNLREAHLRLGEALPELSLLEAGGRLSLSRDVAGQWQFASKGLKLVEPDQQSSAPLDVRASWQEIAETPDAAEDDMPGQVDFTANRLDLPYLTRLAAYFPLADSARKTLQTHDPQGVLEHVRLSWDTRKTEARYTLEADFSKLGVKADGKMPGASGLSGHIRADEKGGQLMLDSHNLSISLPAVFSEPVFPVSRLEAHVDWQKKPETDGVEVQIRQFDFSGPHVGGKVRGRYESSPGEAGMIDLEGDFTNAHATEVWRYIPKRVHPQVPLWLRESLKGGTADAQLTLRGNLKKFPFPDGDANNIFRITVQARDAAVRYHKDWPEIEAVRGDLEFGAGMRIRVKEGRIFSTRISDRTTVVIPDFSVAGSPLLVEGEVEGEMADFLRFVEESPVAASINHFTQPMQGEGKGRLELKLDLPLANIASGKVEGRYHLLDNRVHFMPELPPAHAVNGTLVFSEEHVATDAIRGDFLGKPFNLTVQSGKDAVQIKANGGFAAAALRRELAGQEAIPAALLDELAGDANLQLEVNVRGRTSDFFVTSSLEGLAIRLPEPFAKDAASRLPFYVAKRNVRSQGRDEVVVRLGEGEQRRLDALLHTQDTRVLRGAVAIGMPLRLPEKGLHVLFRQKRLDVDFWQAFLEKKDDRRAGVSGLPLPDMVSLEAQELRFFGHDFAEVNLRLFPQDNGDWQVRLAAKEAVGDLYWDSAGNRITADLRRVRLGEAALFAQAGEAGGETTPSDLEKLPAMDIRIGDLTLGKRDFGKVSVVAENDSRVWRLQNILIENPDGRLTGNGLWRLAPINQSHLDFELVSSDSGKLLGRLGYPGMLRGGSAELAGELEWQGDPLQFNPATLSGNLRMKVGRGQFSRLDPGVGKLLGLLSLQSLTRRLTLDFRDIFSEGYAFDSLAAKLDIQTGVISTKEELRIAGPSGVILMRGSADMRDETQNLALTIQPELSGVAAVGTALAINPLVGAAALLAQTFLKNPLNKVFGIDYQVTGSWNDPVVERKTKFPGGANWETGEAPDTVPAILGQDAE